MPRKLNKRKAIQAEKRKTAQKAKPRRVAVIAHHNGNMAALASLLIAAKGLTDIGDDVLKGNYILDSRLRIG